MRKQRFGVFFILFREVNHLILIQDVKWDAVLDQVANINALRSLADDRNDRKGGSLGAKQWGLLESVAKLGNISP